MAMETKKVKCFVGEQPSLVETEVTTIESAIDGGSWVALPVPQWGGLMSQPDGVVVIVAIKGWESERAVTFPLTATDEEVRKTIEYAAKRMWRMISS
jgi:hypothetical protein